MWGNIEELCVPAFSSKPERQEYLGGNQEGIWLLWQKEIKWTKIHLFQSTAAYRNITIINMMKKRGKNSKNMIDFDLHREGHSELEES